MAWTDGAASGGSAEGPKPSRPPLEGSQGSDNWIPLTIFTQRRNGPRRPSHQTWLVVGEDTAVGVSKVGGGGARVESPFGVGEPAQPCARVTSRTTSPKRAHGVIDRSRDVGRSCPQGFLAETLPRYSRVQRPLTSASSSLSSLGGVRDLRISSEETASAGPCECVMNQSAAYAGTETCDSPGRLVNVS